MNSSTYIKVDNSKCAGCGQCSELCPAGAISESDAIQGTWGGEISVDSVKCILCKQCLEFCAGDAFSVVTQL